MQTVNFTINELFDGSKIYVVPRYQRLYVWNLEDQWVPLWEDVTEVARNLVENSILKGLDRINESASESHFFGTFVLKTSGYTPDLVNRWRVIDGQQRLTTLQLMMSAIADELKAQGLHEQAYPVSRLTSIAPEEGLFSPDKLKIIHGSEHYHGFVDAMNPCANKDEIRGSMGEAYRFFRNSTKEWFENQNGKSKILAEALTASIIVKLRVVAIYVDSNEEEHKIFETLNARGEPLTEWDKIKNLMLYKADENAEIDQSDYFDEYLDRFDQEWWREKVGRGAVVRPRTDIFADYWLESKKAETVAAGRVFREFQNYVKSRPGELVEIGEELTKDAEHYREFEKQKFPATNVERRFHNRRLTMNMGAMWPILFELNRVLIKSNQDNIKRDDCYMYLESFLVRRLLVGYQARSYDQIGIEILKDIREEKFVSSELSDVILRRFVGYTEVSNKWPVDSEVSESVLTRSMPVYVQRLVLEAIEEHLIPENAGYQVLSEAIEVEHIMPQTWDSTDWPIEQGLDDLEAITRRDSIIHTLGNLTLIKSGLNKLLSSRSWKHKRKLIKKSDNLFMNKKLLDDSSSTWNEESIKKRGEWMASLICEIWSRPKVEK